MDTKTIITSVVISGVLAVCTVPVVTGFVALQDVTPGIVETGHINVSGTVKASRIEAIASTLASVSGQNSSTTGHGVHGTATALTGSANGVTGLSYSSAGKGVFGSASAGTGTSYGGYFENWSVSGRGIRGIALHPTGATLGVEGVSVGTSGTGVFGNANATTGSTKGVHGESASTSGIGVYGLSTATSGTTYGMYAWSNSSSGRGIYANVNSATGVNYGVRGQTASSSGYGVYSAGNFGASGTKAFRIDHPSDPENKYLVHYSAEGPEPMNQYSGNVVTNAQGVAWVQLPEYFEQINRDFRYTLTILNEGDGFAQAKIWRKIKGNQFAIQTSSPNVEVSWEVKAIRNDLWVQKHGAPIEVEKVGNERGAYQHPELYGMPKERSMDYQLVAKTMSGQTKPKR